MQNKTLNIIRGFFLILITLFLSACERDGAVLVPDTLSSSDPDSFAQYLNKMPALAAGDYRLIATTLDAGVSAAYRLTIVFDDGGSEVIDGNWNNTVGKQAVFDITAFNSENIHGFTLKHAGGIKVTLEAAGQSPLVYLVDKNDNVLFDTATAYPGIVTSANGVDTVSIQLFEKLVDMEGYARAYYDAIDPSNERDTLYKWRLANCFNNDPADKFGADVFLIFRDTRDLGYGRKMYWKFGCDGDGGEDAEPGAISVFVENFNVALTPNSDYSSLNLDAAIKDDRFYHFGVNAIEYRKAPGAAAGSKRFARFYTFRPLGATDDADEVRLLKVDLDDRGDKAMPVPCIYCHGGYGLPLQTDGQFYLNPFSGIRGDTEASLQLLDIDKLEFVETGEFTREKQEADLKRVNQAVYCSYPGATAAFCSQANAFDTTFEPAPAATGGEWTAAFIRTVVQGWYGGDDTDNSFPAVAYDGSSLPPGWDPVNPANASAPGGIDRLYLDVLKPSCLVCHARQGNALGSDVNAGGDGKDVDFSSYTKFLTYADRIEELVYEEGVMPLSLIGYETFWNSDEPAILASFLPGFSHFDADGKITPPGRPVSNAGPDRHLNSPAHISGEASRFAEQYLWEIVDSPAGSSPVLTDVESSRVLFDTDMEGEYTLKLTVTQGSLEDSDTVVITQQDSLPEALAITYENNIVPLLGAAGTYACDSCHSDIDAVTPGVQGAQPGVPYTVDDTGEERSYVSLRNRVNLLEPQDSLLLRKIRGEHHYGGKVIDPESISGEPDYNTILTWIIEGVIEK